MPDQFNFMRFKILPLTAGLIIVLLTAACQSTTTPTLETSVTPITSSGTPSAAAFIAGGSLQLSAPAAIRKGDSFQVEVIIDTPDLIRGVQWSLEFDPAGLRCDSFEEGPFLKDWATEHAGSTLLFPQPVINNESGAVPDTGIAVLSQSAGGVTGRGVLGTYRCTALRDSPSLPVITRAKVAGETGSTSAIAIK